MLATTESAALVGIEAQPVHIEVNTGEKGEFKIVVVGLPDAAVRESTDRVLSALMNSGYRAPHTKTTVNLAPGSLRKEGPSFDLPIALGMLEATDQLPEGALDGYMAAGELALSGSTRAVRGGLAMGQLARERGVRGLLLPKEAAREACLVEGVPVYAIQSLDQAARFLSGKLALVPMVRGGDDFEEVEHSHAPDFADVKGQQSVRRAVEIAVAGSHNFLMIGPPGSGKSMIAKRIPSIMPPLEDDEFLEILQIHSAAGKTIDAASPFERLRPFRSPHHTISDVGLLGGGTVPGPGEISMAHNGVLFLDELPEFRRSVLEVMRQPLEDGEVTISRSAGKVTLPSRFMLVAAMNPTPSGYAPDDPQGRGTDTPTQIERYRSRISGPLLDRIDIQTEAPAVSIEELQRKADGESSATIRERVIRVRAIQRERFQSKPGVRSNAQMSHRDLERFCELTTQQQSLLKAAMERLNLSARAYDRIRKVARTISDMSDSETINDQALLEAIHYRSLDRSLT